MCPDRQLISLYVDGELPSPWKEKLESHLASCPSCAKVAESYKGISAAMGSIPVERMDAAKVRVWNVVAQKAAVEHAAPAWRRRLVLPIPAAIAAALAVAMVTAGGVGVAVASNKRKVEAMAVIKAPKTPAVPVSDMGSVLRYLESQDATGEILIIKLPDNSNFAYEGQPTLIKAADYNGRPLP